MLPDDIKAQAVVRTVALLLHHIIHYVVIVVGMTH